MGEERENEIFIFSAFREHFLSHISRLLIKTGDRPAAGGGLRDRILGGHQAPRQEAAGEMKGLGGAERKGRVGGRENKFGYKG